MRTRLLPPTAETIREAAEVILAGGLVAFPTETVYGLGGNALDESAVRRIFEAKHREQANPLIVHVSGFEMASQLGKVPRELADSFWPGALTLVVWKSGVVPGPVTAGGPTVGLRCPSHPIASALILAAGVPIAAPSANRSTGVSAVTARHVLDDLEGSVEIVIDGGQSPKGIESTVLDVTTSPPRILRPGSVSRAQIELIVGQVETGPETGPSRSPGQGERHYATRTRLHLAEGNGSALVESLTQSGMKVGWMPIGVTGIDGAEVRSMPTGPDEYGAALYSTLRELDQLELDAIVVEKPPPQPEWAAILDRLRRASVFH